MNPLTLNLKIFDMVEKFTKATKELAPQIELAIVMLIGVIGIGATLGWVFGNVDTKDVMMVISPIVTGFFAMVRGQ